MTAGRPDSAESEPDVDLLTVKKSLLRHQGELFRRVEDTDGSVAAARRIAVLQESIWNLTVLVCQLEADDDGAAKASREATRHGELAVKLSKSTVPDRVTALERALVSGVRKGRGIADAAKKRKRAKE